MSLDHRNYQPLQGQLILGLAFLAASSMAGCAKTTGQTAQKAPSQSTDQTSTDTQPEQNDTSVGVSEGALVTNDCLYQDYPYAIDILLSCGSERFDAELRLHTFKRHSHAHQQVFTDQRLTYRNNQLWFDGYDSPRCITINQNGKLFATAEEADCSEFLLTAKDMGFVIQTNNPQRCVALSDAACTDHRSTGGYECGGIAHRYLPIVMGDCSNGLVFNFATKAESCSDELPEDACF